MQDSKEGGIDWIINVQEGENRWKGKLFFGVERGKIRYKETQIFRVGE